MHEPCYLPLCLVNKIHLCRYEAMMELPRWKARGGLDFVFYDSHPGFAAGKSARPYGDLKCVTFRNATHLIVDTPMRNVCDRARGGMWPMNKLMITPCALLPPSVFLIATPLDKLKITCPSDPVTRARRTYLYIPF